eukprot:g37857.t1
MCYECTLKSTDYVPYYRRCPCGERVEVWETPGSYIRIMCRYGMGGCDFVQETKVISQARKIPGETRYSPFRKKKSNCYFGGPAKKRKTEAATQELDHGVLSIVFDAEHDFKFGDLAVNLTEANFTQDRQILQARYRPLLFLIR